jgi:hypothetical protein
MKAPAVTPWYVQAILVFLLGEALLSILIIASAHRARCLAIAAVLPQLWIGFLASFIAAWGATSGGTLGAL